jgi:hypothetical protein
VLRFIVDFQQIQTCLILLEPFILLFFHLELQQWQLTSKTCGDQKGTEIFNSDGTITVMVRI